MLANPTEQICRLLAQSRTIAIIGLSSDPSKPSYQVASYLQAQGYTILPIHPRGGEIDINGTRLKAFATLHECARSLHEQGARIDILNVFRKSEALPQVADDILALTELAASLKSPAASHISHSHSAASLLPSCVWVQLGLASAQARAKLTQAGIYYIEDSCIKIEHARLMPKH